MNSVMRLSWDSKLRPLDLHSDVLTIVSGKRVIILTFTTLGAYSAEDKLVIFFTFPKKQDLTFHANCPHSMKNITNSSSAEILPRVLSINKYHMQGTNS